MVSIKESVKRSGATRQQFADMLGISVHTLNAYMKGSRVTPERILTIADKVSAEAKKINIQKALDKL